MTLSKGDQILKTRDDTKPIRLVRGAEPPADPTTGPFRLASEAKCSWAKADEDLGPEKLRPRVEPWLTALVQSEHLSLLAGSGLTHAVHRMATDGPLRGMNAIAFNTLKEEITKEARRTAQLAGRSRGNFEDQIRAANDLLRGLEIMASGSAVDGPEQANVWALRKDLEDALRTFSGSILEAEQDLLSAPEVQREQAFNYLVSFLMSFASRSGTRERLQLYTTNYDRYIEAGADVAGLRLMDRFVGSLAPVFRASRLDVDLHYDPPGIRGEPRYLEGVVRFAKLHGSVDWIDYDGTIRRIGLPFGAAEAAPFLTVAGIDGAGAMQLMVYPNAAKDRETASYPYVELFRDFAAGICRPNSTVICYGYGFGDEHINRVLADMLTIPSTHLVVISYDDPLDRIMKTYEALGRHAQITLLVGDHFGDLGILVDHYLPKPAIDRTTFRMADLLKQRWTAREARAETLGEVDEEEGRTS